MKVALLCEYSRGMKPYLGSNIYVSALVSHLARRPELASVAETARECVEQEITYERAVERFAAVIEELGG